LSGKGPKGLPKRWAFKGETGSAGKGAQAL